MRTILFIILICPTLLFGQTSSATPPTSESEFVKYLNNNFSVNKKDVSGLIELEFRVSETGVLDSFNIVKDIGDNAALDLIKVIKKAGNWSPALEDGKPKASWVSLPYKVWSAEDISTEDIIEAVPVEGIETFRKKFLNNFRYPEQAIKAGISGTFSLQFVVNELGELKNIKLLKDPGYDIEINAIRALKRAGKWKPAHVINKNIESTVKFDFTLDLKEFNRGVF